MKVSVTSSTCACPVCGADMRVQSYYEDAENPSNGQPYKQYKRFQTCSQTECPNYGVRISLPQADVSVVLK